MNKRTERGQVLILLLLIVLVVLTVVLAIAERSTSSLSNSDKTDQSSRAFSAAEAGVEAAQSGGASSGNLNNQSNYSFAVQSNLPAAGTMLEYPPIGKETIAQFWLVNPSTLTPPYTGNAEVYFGYNDPSKVMDITKESAAAIEVNVVTYDSGTGEYNNNRLFYDSNTSSPDRAVPGGNGFTPLTCVGYTDDSEFGSSRNFKCKASINFSTDLPYPGSPILMRVRFLYTNEKQPLGVQPIGAGVSLAPIASIITSTGYSGNSIQKIQVFQVPHVVTPFMDYALFSYGDISK